MRDEATGTVLGVMNIFTDPVRRPLGDAERAGLEAADGLRLPEPTLSRAKIFRDRLKDGTEGPPMLALRGGTLQMGSPADEPERAPDEGPQHQVTIRPFPIGRTEVTLAWEPRADAILDELGKPEPKRRVQDRLAVMLRDTAGASFARTDRSGLDAVLARHGCTAVAKCEARLLEGSSAGRWS